jgi:galactokinase
MCGIMDQFASVMGKKDYVFQLDCRSLAYNYFPFNQEEYQFVLCNSGVKHSHADSGYNTRRNESEQGVSELKKKYPKVSHLRDVSIEMLNGIKESLPQIVYNRCKYVIEENNRVIKSCEALKNNDIYTFGKLMYESHNGLSNLYEVSCEEVDFLVDFTKNNKSILGSRMMGGGFGGCSINLVKRTEKEQFFGEIKKAYLSKYNIDLECYEVEIANGTSAIEVI